MSIIISEPDLSYIKRHSIMHPFITSEDIDNIITTEVLKDLIEDAMIEFYRYMPLVVEASYAISSGAEVDIPFPTDETYGVVYSTLVESQNLISNTLNTIPFFTNNRNIGCGVSGDYQRFFPTKSAGEESIAQMHKVFYNTVDEVVRVLRVKSSLQGEVIVHWASKSVDFNQIPFIRKRLVQDLAVCNVRIYWMEVLELQDPELPTSFNSDEFLSKAEDKKESLIEELKGLPKPVILRR